MEDVDDQVHAPTPQDSSKAKNIPWLELNSDDPQAVAFRIRIPVKEYPKFNFVGKLLGPKGHSLKRLQEETGTRMAILGKGSMKDRAKEEECRKEGGKYAHLNEELHVLVEVYAEATDAYNRMAHALTELKKFLTPVNDFDEIRAQQYEEMLYMKGESPARGRGGRGAGPPPRGGRGSLLSAPGRGSPASRGGPPVSYPSRAATGRGAPAPRGGPPGRSAPGAPPSRGRPSAPPPVRPPVETYDYSYGSESYGETAAAYDDSYDQSYGQSETEFYDYGHGAGASNSYNDGYGDSWGGQSTMKSPPVRASRGAPHRAHPYASGRGGY